MLLVFACKKKDDDCTMSPPLEALHVYGASIKASADTFSKEYDGNYYTVLYLDRKVMGITSKNDKKRCPVSPDFYSFFIAEYIDSAYTTLYCDRDIVIRGRVLSSGVNILKQYNHFLIQEDMLWGGYVGLSIDSNAIQKGAYTIYIAGKTTLGNDFIDSVIITH